MAGAAAEPDPHPTVATHADLRVKAECVYRGTT
jgi:hypothetical protein